MLKLARVLLLALLLVFWFLFGLLLCLVRPRHPNNVYVFARMYHAVCPLIGPQGTGDHSDEVKSVGPAVCVCNHQSNYDIFTVTGAVQPRRGGGGQEKRACCGCLSSASSSGSPATC